MLAIPIFNLVRGALFRARLGLLGAEFQHGWSAASEYVKK
jgi:hypothetical protein